jgi:hypothetical protein
MPPVFLDLATGAASAEISVGPSFGIQRQQTGCPLAAQVSASSVVFAINRRPAMLFDRKCICALTGAIMIASSPTPAGAESSSDALAPPGREGASDPSPSESTGKALTGKERLAGKASDDQRTNNCKVPAEKRGPKPRPDSCDHGTIGMR